MSEPITEDFTITVEVKRANRETWLRALIDGVEAGDEETTVALVRRVLPRLAMFVIQRGALPDTGEDGG